MDIVSDQTEPAAAPRIRRNRIPDVVLVGHTGEVVRFHTDLVRDRLVLVNFMSIATHASNPVSANLVEVARALGPRLRADVRMMSVTVDPANDQPEALARFAQRLGAPSGWLFLTGAKVAIDLLRAALFRHGAELTEAESEGRRQAISRLWNAFEDDPRILFCEHPSALQDCSMGLVRYGNDAADVWGSVPARAPSDQILARLSWVQPKPTRGPNPAVTSLAVTNLAVKRGGPWPVSGAKDG
jgi:protein SCO1